MRSSAARSVSSTSPARAFSARATAPFFIDKLPNNFLHLGLIQLALPNAKIIDARRHPLGCCFSGFKQHFARGQNFTYGLEDIGRYYHDYVELMSHFDKVLPGRVHRVFYEAMIEDTEAEVRRLLEYCGLPFEAGCLRFYENERAVRTASSQQVRQPIYRAGLEQWRHYEPWLRTVENRIRTGPGCLSRSTGTLALHTPTRDINTTRGSSVTRSRLRKLRRIEANKANRRASGNRPQQLLWRAVPVASALLGLHSGRACGR